MEIIPSVCGAISAEDDDVMYIDVSWQAQHFVLFGSGEVEFCGRCRGSLCHWDWRVGGCVFEGLRSCLAGLLDVLAVIRLPA